MSVLLLHIARTLGRTVGAGAGSSAVLYSSQVVQYAGASITYG